MASNGVWTMAAEVKVTCPACGDSFYVTLEGEAAEEFNCDYCERGVVRVTLTVSVDVEDLSEEEEDNDADAA